jgi:hypothetical protein
VIDKLGAYIVAYSEHKISCRYTDNVNGMGQRFNGGETEIITQTGHNCYENVGTTQQGGTSLLFYETLIDQDDFKSSRKNGTGLGIWVTMTLKGDDGVATRVVCGYIPCKSPYKATRSTYQQHRRYYITKEKDHTCPRTRLQEDLLKQLTQWREAGDRLTVCMDTNEHIYKKKIGKSLTKVEGLRMQEVVEAFTGENIGAPFLRRTTPIYGIWTPSGVVVTGACVTPSGYGVGDH